MPIVVDPTCRNCGGAIEPLGMDGAYVLSWVHTGRSIHCPGSTGELMFATPTIRAVPLKGSGHA